MSAATLGQHIDGLEIVPTLDEGDLIASAIVILEIIEEDGSSRLCVTWPDDMSFIKRNGMLSIALAQDLDSSGPIRRDEDDD